MPSFDPLVRVYIDALCGRAIYVYSGPNGRSAHFGLEPFFPEKGLVAKLWFARAAHAELVVLRCVQDFKAMGAMRPHGWACLPPPKVVERIKLVARVLGAKWQTQEEIERVAEMVAAEIVAKMEDMRQNGGLGEINRKYKAYRLGKEAKGEKAIGYNAYMLQHQKNLVVHAANLASAEIMPREPELGKWPATKKGRTDPGFTGWTPARAHPKEW